MPMNVFRTNSKHRLKLATAQRPILPMATRSRGALIIKQRWIRGGGWYPDRQLRLFKKNQGRWKQRHIHESVQMNPSARRKTFSGDLLALHVANAAYHHRINWRALRALAARQMFEEGRRTSILAWRRRDQ